MVNYFFFLGSTTDLCWAELTSVLSKFKLPSADRVTTDLAKLELKTKLSDQTLVDLQNTLGGTVKIVSTTKQTDTLEADKITDIVLDFLIQDKPKRFTISEYGRDHLPTQELDIYKQLLKEKGIKSSYASASRKGANAAQLKRGLEELYILQISNQLFFGWTETVQDVDAWAKRDVKKPARDRQKGMLQPKVARMMLNLALGDTPASEAVVLDPFVGTGTILIEAAELGFQYVFGADFSDQAIIQANMNLSWWQKQTSNTFHYELVRKEVSHLSKRDFPQSITHVVTEPFLGKLRPSPQQLPNIQKGLVKLYKGMIKGWQQTLEPGTRLAILLPAWEIKGKIFELDETYKDLERAGFKHLGEPLRAGRVEAITQRLVHMLEYKPYVES